MCNIQTATAEPCWGHHRTCVRSRHARGTAGAHLFGGVLGADGAALGGSDAVVHGALGLQHGRQRLLGRAQRLVHSGRQRLVIPPRLRPQRARLRAHRINQTTQDQQYPSCHITHTLCHESAMH